MNKVTDTYVMHKPFYWRILKDISNEYKVDEELMLEFFKSIYDYTDLCLMSHEEFSAYDMFERDSFLESLSNALIEDYNVNNDEDYAEYYQSFINEVLWSNWFVKLLRTINEEIEVPKWIVKSIEEKSKVIIITYTEK